VSNLSRGRLAAMRTPAQEPEPVPGWRDRVRDAMETAGRPGLEKLVGLILEDKERADHPAPPVDLDAEPSRWSSLADSEPAAVPFRDPTAYERAVLSAMGTRPMYGGTVEPWRVADRRRRNRAARAARRINRRKASR
jgi:hypothetical protein